MRAALESRFKLEAPNSPVSAGARCAAKPQPRAGLPQQDRLELSSISNGCTASSYARTAPLSVNGAVRLLLRLHTYRRGPVADALLASPEFAAWCKTNDIEMHARGADFEMHGSRVTGPHELVLTRYADAVLATLSLDSSLWQRLRGPLCETMKSSELLASALTSDERSEFAVAVSARQEELLAVALNRYFAHQHGELLSERQDESLRSALAARGADSPQAGYRALSRRSRNNVLALQIAKARDDDAPQLQRARRAIAKLGLVAIHNTTKISGAPEAPLMSSRELEKLGAPGGRNTHPFNRGFLATDDQVFFHVFIGDAADVTSVASTYGHDALSVVPTYLRQKGWVSAFMMTPADLSAFAEIAGIVPSDRPLRGPGWQTADPLWRAARDALANLDFTVRDFVALVKRQLHRTMCTLYDDSPEQFAQALATLENGDLRAKTQLVCELVLRPLGMPDRMELKIPIAVPREAILDLENAETSSIQDSQCC